jgi:hypothetical protein
MSCRFEGKLGSFFLCTILWIFEFESAPSLSIADDRRRGGARGLHRACIVGRPLQGCDGLVTTRGRCPGLGLGRPAGSSEKISSVFLHTCPLCLQTSQLGGKKGAFGFVFSCGLLLNIETSRCPAGSRLLPHSLPGGMTRFGSRFGFVFSLSIFCRTSVTEGSKTMENRSPPRPGSTGQACFVGPAEDGPAEARSARLAWFTASGLQFTDGDWVRFSVCTFSPGSAKVGSFFGGWV